MCRDRGDASTGSSFGLSSATLAAPLSREPGGNDEDAQIALGATRDENGRFGRGRRLRPPPRPLRGCGSHTRASHALSPPTLSFLCRSHLAAHEEDEERDDRPQHLLAEGDLCAPSGTRPAAARRAQHPKRRTTVRSLGWFAILLSWRISAVSRACVLRPTDLSANVSLSLVAGDSLKVEVRSHPP